MKASLKQLLAILILLPALTFAQKAPGYLGKRFSVEYNVFIFPSFANPNNSEIAESDSYLSEVKPSLNLQHYLLGQYSFSKQASLIGSFGFTKTNYIPTGANDYDEPRYSEYPEMTALSYNAGIRIFTQHYAPLGRYVEFRIGAAQVKTEDFSYLLYISSTEPPTYTIEGGDMWRPTIAVAWGTNRIIRDILIISYGFDINFFAGGVGYNRSLLTDARFSSMEFDQGNTNSNQKELLRLAAGRYGMQCFLNLRLGVGILL